MGRSSIGRAPVFGTVGWRFESSRPSHHSTLPEPATLNLSLQRRSRPCGRGSSCQTMVGDSMAGGDWGRHSGRTMTSCGRSGATAFEDVDGARAKQKLGPDRHPGLQGIIRPRRPTGRSGIAAPWFPIHAAARLADLDMPIAHPSLKPPGRLPRPGMMLWRCRHHIGTTTAAVRCRMMACVPAARCRNRPIAAGSRPSDRRGHRWLAFDRIGRDHVAGYA